MALHRMELIQLAPFSIHNLQRKMIICVDIDKKPVFIIPSAPQNLEIKGPKCWPLKYCEGPRKFEVKDLNFCFFNPCKKA